MTLLTLALAFPLMLTMAAPSFAQTWGCYDPKPGHPSPEEKLQFIADVSDLAVDAERKHGIPAAALAAMSMAESGYGWTRTAIEAKNLFGWKFNSSTAAGGRSAYVLGCQPLVDKNNRYVVFSSSADAFDFVANKLATLAYYRKSTEAYRKARANGVAAEEASKAWLAGIANPYNWKPAEYVRTITRLMNDPVSPSETREPARNLYRLSEGVSASAAVLARATPKAPQDAGGGLSTATATLASTQAYFAARLSKRTCDAPVNDFVRWATFPVQRCLYSDSGVTVQTYMLNPSADQLARWTVTACADAQAAAPAACASAVSKAIMAASSGVFPVAGFIPEPASSGGGVGSRVLCFLFRDGVTVTTLKVPSAPAAVDGHCVSSNENDEPVVKAKRYARVASTTRDDYRRSGGLEEVGTEVNGDPRWLDVVRTLYQKAWGSDRNELISARAKAMKASGAFR